MSRWGIPPRLPREKDVVRCRQWKFPPECSGKSESAPEEVPEHGNPLNSRFLRCFSDICAGRNFFASLWFISVKGLNDSAGKGTDDRMMEKLKLTYFLIYLGLSRLSGTIITLFPGKIIKSNVSFGAGTQQKETAWKLTFPAIRHRRACRGLHPWLGEN